MSPTQEQNKVPAVGCQPCRELHLKCDRGVPSCGRCLATGRECKRGYKFRAVKSNFAKNQKWTRPSKGLTFVDETSSLTNSGHGTLFDESQRSSSEDEDESTSDHRGAGHGDIANSAGTGSPSLPTFQGSGGRDSPTNRFIFHRPDPGTSTHLGGLGMGPEGQPLQPPQPGTTFLGAGSSLSPFENRYYGPSAMPLKSHDEAMLFRHYIQKIAISLDASNPYRHFELVVPQRAETCPPLLNAIFAISARHLSHTSRYDPLASNRYHDECLQFLIPMLSHTSTVADENLFAATVILRMLEEMDVTVSGKDNYSHLLGIHAFVNVGDRYLHPNGLSAAAFWVGLRQEVYISVINQQPVKMSLEHFIVDRSFEPADDYTWANRAVVFIADVLNFCFGEMGNFQARWAALNEFGEKWESSRPASFNPFYFKEREEGEAFPQVWHHQGCHVIGYQHFMLGQLFLAFFDPKIPRVGAKRNAAMRRVMHQMEPLMRRLCGVGLCNQWWPPAMFASCMGIAMFGDRFEDRRDQEALISLLKTTEDNYARPTEGIQQQLMKSWGWIPDLDHEHGPNPGQNHDAEQGGQEMQLDHPPL